MNANKSYQLLLSFLLFATASISPRLFAQGTAFTYQGRLNENGSPANGRYDLLFAIYDSTNNPGVLIAGLLTNSATGVSNGLFTVTLDFGMGVFDGNPRWMEISVSTNGADNYFTLAPRQRLSAAPYAITAANVTGPINGAQITAGTITGTQLASGAVTAANIASNSISAAQLANGAAAANLNASGQTAVPSGGMVLSSNYPDANLLNAGYVKLAKVDLGDDWEQRSTNGAPSARDRHTAVWTGSEMIVWGGTAGPSGVLNDGGRYNPAANSWTAVATSNAPSARDLHTAVWTGSEMIVWGGFGSSGALNDGGRYNPAADSWTAVTTNLAPTARYQHTVVWTGSEMIVWGGLDNGNNYLGTGGRYNPTNNSWTTVNFLTAPLGRTYHTAVWTGSEMIVWGGYNLGGDLNNGGRYNPTANSWTPVSTSGAPIGRGYHTAVWTGSEMIVWGGYYYDGNDHYLNNGGRYNPTANSWTSVSTSGAPVGRGDHTAVWTGSEMIVWGGYYYDGNEHYLNNGGRYNPTADSWAVVASTDALAGREFHTLVWTGSGMIVWGGYYYDGNDHYVNDAFSYTPTRVLYLYQRP